MYNKVKSIHETQYFLGETLSGENPSLNSSFDYSDELHKSIYNSPLWADNIPREM